MANGNGGISFDKKITLGNLLTIASLLISIFGYYVIQERRLTIMEQQVAALREADQRHEASLRQLYEDDIREQAKTNDKLEGIQGVLGAMRQMETDRARQR